MSPYRVPGQSSDEIRPLAESFVLPLITHYSKQHPPGSGAMRMGLLISHDRVSVRLVVGISVFVLL